MFIGLWDVPGVRDTHLKPTEYENANDSLLSERYSAKEFTKYYQGLVYGAGEGEKALIFASLEKSLK